MKGEKKIKSFQKMDTFLGRKHNIEPPVITDTMAEGEGGISVPGKQSVFFHYKPVPCCFLFLFF